MDSDAEMAEKVNELLGAVAALKAYVANLPGASEVDDEPVYDLAWMRHTSPRDSPSPLNVPSDNSTSSSGISLGVSTRFSTAARASVLSGTHTA
jgi:hypothetical protein